MNLFLIRAADNSIHSQLNYDLIYRQKCRSITIDWLFKQKESNSQDHDIT